MKEEKHERKKMRMKKENVVSDGRGSVLQFLFYACQNLFVIFCALN